MQFRDLPSVETVMAVAALEDLAQVYSRPWLVDLVRDQLQVARDAIGKGGAAPTAAEVAEEVRRAVNNITKPSPRPVINATGVVIHTNLGRAPLSQEAIDAATHAAQGYSDLELNLATGRRGSRQAHLQFLLRQLTGAEAALAVNNNASAVLLGLSALAAGKAVIVSRGEAVEIGGGFRIPDVLVQSGASLVDVGTTNRTYARDYENAVTEETAAFLKAHASNFRVEGFTAAVEPAELVELGRRHQIPVLHDVGSGCLLNTEKYGMAHEPTPQESVKAGVGLTFFSGDKLLGGPQAGIVVGTRELVARLERHPLARAVRIDKLSLASLNATLLHYLLNEAEGKIPIWRMISVGAEEIERRALSWQSALETKAPETKTTVTPARSAIGGGSLPGETLPSWVLAISCQAVPGGPDAVLARLRQGETPVVARILDGQVLLDPRTVLPEEEPDLIKCLQTAVAG
jgi:L-seryl-tRNA(Ser) seleniumtransferase